MIRFLDGPAGGKVLTLKRAPLYLRVTRGAGGEWDALDRLDDEPRQGETLFAYLRQNKPSALHLNYGRRGGSGWYQVAEYRLVEPQPDDATMRETARWRAWCEQKAKEPAR